MGARDAAVSEGAGAVPGGEAPWTERRLCWAWDRQRWTNLPLRTTGGEVVEVIYRGRWTSDRGPDFRDAILATARGELWHGDLEMHLKTSDWRAHGHHRDPSYNRVILHLVLDDDGAPTLRQDGRAVAVVALGSFLPPGLGVEGEGPLAPAHPRSASLAAADPAELRATLTAAGLARLRAKAARLEGELASDRPAQVLYAGLLESLGYTRNRRPARELARRVPLAHLEAALAGKGAARQMSLLQAGLLGTAGLLPSQRGLRWPLQSDEARQAEELEEEWEWLRRGWDLEPMEAGAWDFFRVRPENFPPRRLAGASYLLHRCLGMGLVETLLGPLRQGEPSAAWRPLEALLGVEAGQSYWARRCDFGPPSLPRASRLIGPDRARDMAVNVVLPFALAYGELTGDEALAARAVAAYRAYPKLASNEILRHMLAEVGLAGDWGPLAAAQQQGLLHLFQSWYAAGRGP